MLRIGYDARRFEALAIRRLLDHYKRLLEEIAENPDRPLAEITMLTRAEHESHDDRGPGGRADDLIGATSEPIPTEIHRLDDDELDAYIAEVRRSIGETAR